jgi:hypothetical protein
MARKLEIQSLAIRPAQKIMSISLVAAIKPQPDESSALLSLAPPVRRSDRSGLLDMAL